MKLKVAGDWKDVKPYIRVEGVWVPVDSGNVRVAGVWKQFYVNEVAVTLANSTQVNIQNLFSAEDWADAKPKRVIIPAGVEIGSTNPSVAALSSGTGRGGPLIIDADGTVSGAGGAVNSGVGGNAFHAEQEGIDLILSGTLRSGGGGGGAGGQGGGGYYTYTSWSGYSHSGTTYWNLYSSGHHQVAYNNALIYNSNPGPSNPYYTGGYWYQRGSLYSSGDLDSYYIRRGSNVTAYTSGGGGGNGGRGEGYGQSALAGANGNGGGTNAGTGGQGGTGGGYGANGNGGNTGASGNNGGGAGGSSGGSAGLAIVNPQFVNLINNGTILG